MLLIMKETAKLEPYIINSDDCDYLSDLGEMIDCDKDIILSLHKITPDGLYALCTHREILERLSPNDKLNCAIVNCTQEYPWNIKTATSNVIFFRFKYSNNIFNLFPEDSKEDIKDGEIDLNPFFDNFAIAPVNNADAKYIGAMLSAPRQAKLFKTVIGVINSLVMQSSQKSELANNNKKSKEGKKHEKKQSDFS